MWMKPELTAVSSEAKLRNTENCCLSKARDFVKSVFVLRSFAEKKVLELSLWSKVYRAAETHLIEDCSNPV